MTSARPRPVRVALATRRDPKLAHDDGLTDGVSRGGVVFDPLRAPIIVLPPSAGIKVQAHEVNAREACEVEGVCAVVAVTGRVRARLQGVRVDGIGGDPRCPLSTCSRTHLVILAQKALITSRNEMVGILRFDERAHLSYPRRNLPSLHLVGSNTHVCFAYLAATS